jgi:hypothetical protein
MKLKDTQVFKIPYKDAKAFCSVWHYSGSCPGCKLYFGLYYNLKLIGIMALGEPAMRFQKQCYDVDLELRRLCLIDDTPKNAESFFIGKCMKLVKIEGFNSVLSLADPNFGHTGVIYRASNFEYIGVEKGGGSRDIFIDGKHYHSRTAYAKFGASGYKKLSAMFPDKTVEVKNKERKHVYIYKLLRSKSANKIMHRTSR